MQFYIYLVLCFGFFFPSVTCDCDKDCDLLEWIVYDCKPCCEMDASPLSAVQKRRLCCPPGYGLAQCISHCKFTNDEIEQKGQCTIYCKDNCTGGFHFATTTILTTTSTTATTTPTTTLYTTTTPTTTSQSTTTPTPTTITSTTTTPTTTTTTTTPKTTTTPTTTTISTPTTSTATTPTTTTTPTRTTISTSTTSTATTPTTTTTPTRTTTSTSTTSTSTATTTTTMTAQTTSVPTITPTVSSDYHPVYLSSIKKPLDEKSTKPKACTTRKNYLKAGVPLLIWLPLLGILVGAVATVCLFWISRRKHRKATVNTKTSGKRNARTIPMYKTAYDKDVNMSSNSNGKRRTPNAFGNSLAF